VGGVQREEKNEKNVFCKLENLFIFFLFFSLFIFLHILEMISKA